MEHTISRLLKAYESGKLHRRDLVKGLTLLAAGAESASAAGFQSNGINHVSLQVSDLQRSSEFYQRVLVVPAENRPAGAVTLKVGKGHIVLRPGTPAGKVDHFAVGVDHFNKDTIIADLKARGAMPSDSGDAGLHVVDPDGYPVQFQSNDAA
jgi:catechol 2,3-dioxygenase-like lactoylglutathione lyase family enzyme